MACSSTIFISSCLEPFGNFPAWCICNTALHFGLKSVQGDDPGAQLFGAASWSRWLRQMGRSQRNLQIARGHQQSQSSRRSSTSSSSPEVLNKTTIGCAHALFIATHHSHSHMSKSAVPATVKEIERTPSCILVWRDQEGPLSRLLQWTAV